MMLNNFVIDFFPVYRTAFEIRTLTPNFAARWRLEGESAGHFSDDEGGKKHVSEESVKELEKIIKENQAKWHKEYGLDDDSYSEMDFADNQTPISFDTSFNPDNNTNQTAEASKTADEAMKEDNDVTFFSPVEESVTPIIEDEFKTQGKRRHN
ncbi:hypothetical protein AVEN_39291-1 [Araneus ventricosus]|uniref:Uncharacterized protein n=1 Tax=Araneus ventricosus TaxID=182803 RepID=A0A4Y2S2M8_ARAVE|nr:hypothetical protein AVEN_39291-1 [Araneus ventricosus]